MTNKEKFFQGLIAIKGDRSKAEQFANLLDNRGICVGIGYSFDLPYYYIVNNKVVYKNTTTLPAFTLDEILDESTETLIGYRLKDDCKQYEEAACKITGVSKLYTSSNGTCFDPRTPAHNSLTAAQVMHWFEEVYEKKFKVGDWVVVKNPCESSQNKIGFTEKITKIDTHGVLNGFGNCIIYQIGSQSYEHRTGLRHATEEEIKTAKKAAEKIMIGEYEVKLGSETVNVNDVYYVKSDLEVLLRLMKKGQIKSLNCGCTGQYKVGSETIERVINKLI